MSDITQDDRTDKINNQFPMKLTEKQQLELAEEFLNGFTVLLKEYLVKMNLPFVPVMELHHNKDWKKALTLDEIIEIVNADIRVKYAHSYPEGLRTRSRDREIVIRRQIVFKMGRDMGHTYSYIGKKFGLDHATVLHGVKTINDQLDTGSMEVKGILRDLESIIKHHYLEKYGESVSETDRSTVNA